jgi:TatD DNase family protein
VRSSFKELFPVLEAAQERHDGKIRGVFHCFSGGKKQINRALRLGEFYFGLGGSTTYNRSATDPVVKNIPTDRILLETDAPYLTPTNKKGQKNEPGFLLEVAQTVSEIKGISLEELAEFTTVNAEKLFG